MKKGRRFLRPEGTDSPSSNTSSHWSWGSTPKTIKRFEIINWNLRHLERQSIDFKENLDKLVKGSIAQAHLVEELRRELNETQAAVQARQLRSKTSRHRIPTSGIVSSNELERMKRIEPGVTFYRGFDQVEEQVGRRRGRTSTRRPCQGNYYKTSAALQGAFWCLEIRVIESLKPH
jgi:hypothetical protein